MVTFVWGELVLTGAIPRILGFTVVGGKRYVFEKVFDVGLPSADFEGQIIFATIDFFREKCYFILSCRVSVYPFSPVHTLQLYPR